MLEMNISVFVSALVSSLAIFLGYGRQLLEVCCIWFIMNYPLPLHFGVLLGIHYNASIGRCYERINGFFACHLSGFLSTRHIFASVLEESRRTTPSHGVCNARLILVAIGFLRGVQYPGSDEARTAMYQERWQPERNVCSFMVWAYS